MAPAAVGGALAVIAVSEALGRLLSAALQLGMPRAARWLCGAALLHIIVFALGVAHWLTPGAFVGVALAAIGVAFLLASPPASATRPWPRWIWIALIPFSLLYFFYAGGPERSPDGLAYHVALPLRYLRAQALVFVPFNMYAQLSQGLEMLFTFAIGLGNASSSALTHLAFLFALAASLWRIHPSGAAMVLVFCAPVAGIDAASAYNDIALAAVIAALVALPRESRFAGVAGLLAGFAFAIKYTGFLAVPYALWAWRANWRLAPGAALMIVPWLAKNWLATGNPVAPFANYWFPNAVFDPALESAYVASMRHYAGFTGWVSWPLEVTTRGFVLAGLLGPVFLLVPLAIRQWRWLALAGFWALPYASNIGTRFLLPSLGFVSIALAAALGRWAMPVALLHAALSWPSLAGFYAHPQAWRIKDFAPRLREEAMARTLDRVVRPNERVLAFSQFPDALTQADMVTAPLSRPGVELRQAVWYTKARQFLPTVRRRFWILGQPVSQVRFRSSGSIAEIEGYALLEAVPGSSSDGNWLTRSPGPLHAARFARPVNRIDLIAHGREPIEPVGFRWVEGEAAPPNHPGDLVQQARNLLVAQQIRYLLLQDRDYGPALGALTPQKNMEGWPVDLVDSGEGLWLYRLK